MGPEALRVANLADKLSRRGFDVIDRGNLQGPVNPWQPPQDGYRHLPQVVAWNQAVHTAVYTELTAGRLPIMLGGDHCLAIGSISAVARYCREQGKKLRVLWLDAHADFNTADVTPSGNIHGMPLASIMGYGPPELTELGGVKPMVEPRNVAIVGVRDLDAKERRLVTESGVHVFTMRQVMSDALRCAGDGTAGVAVSLDMDFVDPSDAPGVGTPVRGGATYREAHLALEMIADSGTMVSFELVEINPVIDLHNTTAILGVELILSGMGKKIL